MGKAKDETNDPRPKIKAYFKARKGHVAKASTDLQYLVRQQCSLAGIGTSDEEMAVMAGGLATYRLADYALPPLKRDKDGNPTA